MSKRVILDSTKDVPNLKDIKKESTEFLEKDDLKEIRDRNNGSYYFEATSDATDLLASDAILLVAENSAEAKNSLRLLLLTSGIKYYNVFEEIRAGQISQGKVAPIIHDGLAYTFRIVYAFRDGKVVVKAALSNEESYELNTENYCSDSLFGINFQGVELSTGRRVEMEFIQIHRIHSRQALGPINVHGFRPEIGVSKKDPLAQEGELHFTLAVSASRVLKIVDKLD